MKIATIRYRTLNIGDDIQSVALERLLPRVDLRVERDDLGPAAAWGENVYWVINGWYAAGLMRVWPPPGRARRLFVGFHSVDELALPPAPALPIGCRDPWTLLLCARNGIDAWLSWCATLTLEPIGKPRGNEVLLVDVCDGDLQRLPPRIAAGKRVTHNVSRDCNRQAEATSRLERYAVARWVVTTRLHALLPCVALGTPVVFIKPPNSLNRYAGYSHLAWRIADAPWDEPRPKFGLDVIHSLTVPLRDAVRRFLAS